MNQIPSDIPEKVNPEDMPDLQDGSSNGNNSRGNALVRLGLPVLLGAVLAYIVIGFAPPSALVSKKDFTANLGTVAEDIKTLNEGTVKTTDIESIKGDINTQVLELSKEIESTSVLVDNIITQLSQYVKSEDLQTMKDSLSSAQSQISQIQNSFNSLQESVNSKLVAVESYKTSIDEMNQKIDTLDQKILVMQDTIDSQSQDIIDLQTNTTTTTTNQSGSTTVVDGLAIKITNLGTEILEGSSTFSDIENIKLEITNNNTVDVTGLKLYLYLYPDYNLSSKMIAVDMDMSGDMSCSLVSSGSDEFIFRTGRVNIPAEKSKRYYLTPTIQLNPIAYMPYKYDYFGETIYTDQKTYSNQLLIPVYVDEVLDHYISLDGTSVTVADYEAGIKYSDNTGKPTTVSFGTAINNGSYIDDDIYFDIDYEIYDYNIG